MNDTPGNDAKRRSRKGPRTAERATARPSRTQESRVADPVREEEDYDWSEPTLLDARHCPPRPGYVQRWIRVLIQGKEDGKRRVKAYNQGWRPRLLETVANPEMVPSIDYRGNEVIGVVDMVLMERPEKLHAAQARYNRQATRDQMIAMEEHAMAQHERGSGMGPVRVDRNVTRSTTTVGSGRPAPVADDD